MDFSEIADDDISNLGFEFDNDKSSPPKKLGGRGGRGGRMRGMPTREFGPMGGPPPRFMGPGPPGPPFSPMRPPFSPREHPFPRHPFGHERPPFDHRGPPFDHMDPGFGPRFGPRGPRGPPREHNREPPFSPKGPRFGPRGPRENPMVRGERPMRPEGGSIEPGGLMGPRAGIIRPGEHPVGSVERPAGPGPLQMSPGERPVRPNQPNKLLILPKGPRMPQPRAAHQAKPNGAKLQNQTRPLKQGKQQNKVQKVPQKIQRNGKTAEKTSEIVTKKVKVEPIQNTVNDSHNNEPEEKLLQGNDNEENESKGVDLEDAVSIHGDEEFDIEKDQQEKINETKVQTKTEESKKKVDSENKDGKGRRRDDKFEDRRDFNRGRGRGRDFNRGRGGREFNRGRTPPRFRGPERDMHPPFHDSGHRPFPAGPLPPNFPRPHLGKNIHVNPRFMAPRPGFEGPRGPHVQALHPGQHPFPGQVLPPRFEAPPPGRGLPPRPLHPNPELAARFAPPGQQAGLGAHRMVNPAETLLLRPVHHPQFVPGMSAMSPAMQVGQPSPQAMQMDRMYLGQRMMMSNDRADLAALYNNPAYLARQHPAAMQQAMYENWQQHMRQDQAFDRKSTERPTKRAREKPKRKYSDNSDFSSRSRSGSFSDSRSGSSRSVSRSWSRSKSRSLSPSPTRSWSKSISRSRSRTPVSRSRSSPKREVRMPKVGSPSRHVERSAKRTREIRRESRNERHVARAARVDDTRSRSPRLRRGPRVIHEKARVKERGHQGGDKTRGDKGKVEPSKQRQRERERKPERSRNTEAEARERAGSRRAKTKSRGDSSRHSHRRSPDRKDSKANRVVATKSSTSGKPTNRIVIGSLPDSITPFKLKELLATIGPIEQLKMSTTKHKALVTFEKHEHALACRRKFHRINNQFNIFNGKADVNMYGI